MPILPTGPARDVPELSIRVTPVRFEQVGDRVSIDICFVCCTDVEEDALVSRLFSGGRTPAPRPYPPSYRRFYRARVSHAGRSYEIAACKASDQGALDMLTTLVDVHDHFAPRAVCLVGIAGALDSDLGIGDVVVASRVYLYERGKDRGAAVDRELRSFSMDEELANVVDGAIGDMRRINQDVSITVAPYGTGEKVVASELSEVRDYLLHVDRKVAAVEMESGGFYRYFTSPVFKRSGDVWLVVKGMSDHADPSKGDRDQALAARNSVNGALGVVTRVLEQYELTDSHSIV